MSIAPASHFLFFNSFAIVVTAEKQGGYKREKVIKEMAEAGVKKSVIPDGV